MPANRRFEWFSSIIGFTALASGAQTSVNLLTNQPEATRKGSTVTRILLNLVHKADAVAQLTEFHWGIVFIDSDAAAAGAFPEADVVSDRPDWLARGWSATIADNLSASPRWNRTILDLRMQRICRAEDDELHLILDASASGFSLDFGLFARTLVRLP